MAPCQTYPSPCTKAQSVMPALSILDLMPVSLGQTSSDAIAASLALAQRADELGFVRYWFAEHHNSPAGASSTPAVFIAAAIGLTRKLRLGAGGVMLPNHAPLVVAEQFAALEALAPGRIDLGLGRAPGGDPVIAEMLSRSGAGKFSEHVRTIAAMLTSGGARFQISETEEFEVRATPHATSTPTVWILGSSEYSARLAALLGLPYAFATHFGATDVERTLESYRIEYKPSEAHPQPYVFITANVVAASTVEEAEARALPQLKLIANMHLRGSQTPMVTVDQAVADLAKLPTSREAQLIASMRPTWFGGTGPEVAQQLKKFADKYGVDELMLHPIAGRYASEPPTINRGKIQTIELISQNLMNSLPPQGP